MGINRSYKEKREYPAHQTGKVARLMGLSDEGVRIYERYGLVYPEKRGDSGFRAFDIMDMVMLLYARVYRECGFSMKEASRLANNCELEDVAGAYEEELVKLRNKVERETRRLERMEELLGELREAAEKENCCELVEMPGMYRIEFLRDRGLDASPTKQKKVTHWIEQGVPFVMLSTRYEKETVHLSRSRITALSGLGVREKYAAFLGIGPDEDVTYTKPCPAVHTILRANNQELVPDLSGCLAFVEQQGLNIAGDPIGFGIANLHFQSDFDRFFHLWIPVEQR